MSAADDFVQHLADLVPVSTAAPGAGEREFVHLTGWSRFTRDGNADRIRAWEPGHALMGLMGGPVAVLDVDTKNGADPDRVRQLVDAIGVRVYAEVRTPSGGWHFYVTGHPDLPNVTATADREGLTGHPGVEVLSHGRQVYLPGTARPKYDDAGYDVVVDNLAALADGGNPDGAEALVGWVAEHRATSGREMFVPTEPWNGAPPDKREANYLAAVIRNQAKRVAETTTGGRNTALYNAGLCCGNYIAGAGMDQKVAVDALLDAAGRCGLVADDGEDAALASIQSGLRNGKQRPRAVPPATGANRPDTTHTTGDNSSLADRRTALAVLLNDLRRWQHLPDPTHVVTSLAAAATRHGEGEPCWLLLVAPPSSGKTEAVRLLDKTADARLDEVTSAGLLGWSRGKTVRPSGVLTRVGDRALVTFGDLSSLLATSDRGGRDQVFGHLRRAYDGHVTRDVSPPGKIPDGAPATLSWSGRLTVIACVTGAIDRYTAHADQLGARWVYVRLPERTTRAKRQAAALARRGGLADHRKAARDAAADLLASIPGDPPDLPDAVSDVIEDAALVAAWGRGSVPRNGYGRRDIDGMPVVEEPMRLVQQLTALARGVLALGLPDRAAAVIARRVALDSMPEARRAVLVALADGEELSTSTVARRASMDRKVARHQLQELQAIGVVSNDRVNDEDDELIGTVHWHLNGDDGALVAHVIHDHHRSGGWDDMWTAAEGGTKCG